MCALECACVSPFLYISFAESCMSVFIENEIMRRHFQEKEQTVSFFWVLYNVFSILWSVTAIFYIHFYIHTYIFGGQWSHFYCLFCCPNVHCTYTWRLLDNFFFSEKMSNLGREMGWTRWLAWAFNGDHSRKLSQKVTTAEKIYKKRNDHRPSLLSMCGNNGNGNHNEVQ